MKALKESRIRKKVEHQVFSNLVLLAKESFIKQMTENVNGIETRKQKHEQKNKLSFALNHSEVV